MHVQNEPVAGCNPCVDEAYRLLVGPGSGELSAGVSEWLARFLPGDRGFGLDDFDVPARVRVPDERYGGTCAERRPSTISVPSALS